MGKLASDWKYNTFRDTFKFKFIKTLESGSAYYSTNGSLRIANY